MTLYANEGIPLGGFLYNVFTNKLFDAIANADNNNLWLLPIYCSYIYNKLPNGCHGNEEIVKNWIKNKRAEREEKTI